MKQVVVFILSHFFLISVSFAQQDVYTPKGHLVQAYYWPPEEDYLESVRDSLDDYYTAEYPEATILETYGGYSATRLFNCHGYAWHISEGGDTMIIGLGPLNKHEEIYWEDSSYTETDYPYEDYLGVKVSYGYFFEHDHSAILADPDTYGTGWVVSKWGPTVLIRHAIDDNPGYSSDSLKYYKLSPSMAGSTTNLCYNNIRDFETDITHMPDGTLKWTKGNNLSIIGEDDEPEFKVKGGSSFGWSYVKLEIETQSGFTWESTKNFWTGVFNNTYVTGSSAVCPNSVYTYTAQVPGGHSPSYSYSWTYPSNWYNYGQNQNWITLQTPYYPYYGTVRVSITNECGSSNYSGITVYPGYNCGGYYSMYPNPASDEVTITINQPDQIFEDIEISDIEVSNIISKDQTTYTISIYNSSGTLVSSAIRTGTSFDIPLPKLRDGTYIVELSDGKNSYREQLIIKHE